MGVRRRVGRRDGSAEALEFALDERRGELEAGPTATAVERCLDPREERRRAITEIVVRRRADVGVEIEVDLADRTLQGDVARDR